MTLILTFLVYCYDKGGAKRIRKKARGRLCWWQERFLFHGRESSSESSKELVEDNASTNSPTTIQSLHSPTLPPLSLPLSLARKGRGARMVIISHWQYTQKHRFLPLNSTQSSSPSASITIACCPFIIRGVGGVPFPVYSTRHAACLPACLMMTFMRVFYVNEGHIQLPDKRGWITRMALTLIYTVNRPAAIGGIPGITEMQDIYNYSELIL